MNCPSVTDALLQAIVDSELTRYEISKLSGVPESVLSRFVRGHRSVGLDTVDRLARVLGLELKAVKRPRNKLSD